MPKPPEVEEFECRFKAAKEHKSVVCADIEEVYHFCLDGDGSDPSKKKSTDLDVFSSLPAELAEDFASDLATYLMPEYAEWVTYNAGDAIPRDFRREAREAIEQRKSSMQSALSASNLYAVVNTMFLDFSHGTSAVWHHNMGTGSPAMFEPVHFSELYINVGAYGTLDDRFREQQVTWEFAFDKWPELKNVAKFKGNQTDARKKYAKLVRGFWQDDDFASGKWKEIVMIDDHRVEYNDLSSIADVPLAVGRFRPSIRRPWGFGPGRRMLPDIRTFNEINQMGLENIDVAMNPAFASIGNNTSTDFSDGIEGGMVYDLPPGSSLDKIDLAGDMDVGFFSAERYEQRMMRGFYQDGPRQRGLTPPSASQWLDEARRIQKRLGRPAGPIFDEMVSHIIRRTDKILVGQNKLSAGVEFNGEIVRLEPLNPLTIAQRQEEVVTARSLLTDMATFDPQGFPVTVNTSETFQNIKETLGDRLVSIRTEDQVKSLISQNQGPPPNEEV